MTQIEDRLRTGLAHPGWDTSPDGGLPAAVRRRAARQRARSAVLATAVCTAAVGGGAAVVGAVAAPDRLTSGYAGVLPLPGREIAAGRISGSGPETAPAAATVAVVAEPQEGFELVAYRSRTGRLCLALLGPKTGGASCPLGLQPPGPTRIYVEGVAASPGPALAWGFAPAGADRLVVTTARGRPRQIPLHDGGATLNGARFFLTPLNLTGPAVTFRATRRNDEVVDERQAGGGP